MVYHAKHHVPHHAPKASTGKGVLGSGPSGGRGILGDGPPGSGILGSGPVVIRPIGIVPPPHSSSHRRPATSFCGGTASRKRLATSATISQHRPNAGDDSVIPQAPGRVIQKIWSLDFFMTRPLILL